MGRCALLVFLCASTAGAQSFFACCDQAARHEGTAAPVALMQCGKPEYTEEARLAHLAGTVTMSLTVDDEGIPKEIHVLRPLGLGLDENAVACMRKARYSPAQKDGRPVPLNVSVSVAFEERWDSDWHLGTAVFHPADGATRPLLVRATYPGAAGDHRNVTVCVRLTVGKDGAPHELQVASPQDARLDKEAMAIVADWRFRPGVQKGQPVDVPATFTLVHGVANRTMASSHRPE
jgi:TonB family protein